MGSMILVPGDVASFAPPTELRLLVLEILSLIPQDTEICRYYPVTSVWGYSEPAEICALSSALQSGSFPPDLRFEIAFPNWRGLRYPEQFYNPLIREINRLRRMGCPRQQVLSTVREYAISQGEDPELLLFYIGRKLL